MNFGHFARVLFAIILIDAILALETNNTQKYCDNMKRDPYFNSQQVVGKSWKIFYSWENSSPDDCSIITYKYATPEIIRRIQGAMQKYFKDQPVWKSATLLLTSDHEVLLIPVQGSPGKFRGVPNVAKILEEDTGPMKPTLRIYDMHIKLYDNGSYLVMADCTWDQAHLSIHGKAEVSRSVLNSMASHTGFGEGYVACARDVIKDEDL